jgi:uncharacterized membrane protein YoaK (UPF0700 family)
VKRLPFAHLWRELLIGAIIGGLLFTGLKDLTLVGPYLLVVAFFYFIIQRQNAV